MADFDSLVPQTQQQSSTGVDFDSLVPNSEPQGKPESQDNLINQFGQGLSDGLSNIAGLPVDLARIGGQEQDVSQPNLISLESKAGDFDLPEFNTIDGNAAIFGSQFGNNDTGVGSLISDAFSQTFTGDPAARVDILEKDFPNLKIERIEGGRNAIVTNPANGQQAIVNSKGFSTQDFAPISGQVAAFLPAGRLASAAKTTKGAVAIGSAAAAATDAGLQGLESASGSDQDFNATRTALSGIFGGAGEALALGLSKLFTPKSGDELLQSGRELANRIGLETSDSNQLRKLGEIEVSADTPRIAENIAIADDLGIPLTRGKLSESDELLRVEEQGRRSGSFIEQSRLSANESASSDALNAAIKETDASINGGLSGNSLDENAQAIVNSVSDARNVAKQGVNEAFDNARNFDLVFNANGFKGIIDDVQENLRGQAATITNELTPATVGRLKSIEENLQNTNFAQGLDVVVTESRAINKSLRGSASAEDKNALRVIKNSLDSRVDKLIDDGLFSGDPRAIDALREANKKSAQFFSQFTSSGKQGVDKQGASILEKIADSNVNASEAANLILGSSETSSKLASVSAIRQIKEISKGTDGTAVDSLKSAMFARIIRGVNRSEDSEITKEALRKRLDSAFSGRNSAVINELFSKTEINQMKRLGRALILNKPDSFNPSKTSFELVSRLKNASPLAVGAGGLAFLDTGSAGLATLGFLTLREARGSARSSSALRTPLNSPRTQNKFQLISSSGATSGQQLGTQ